MKNKLLKKYFQNILETFKGGAREESYYSVLESFLEDYAKSQKRKVKVVSHPKKTEAGNPDFRVWDGKHRVYGYIEAKDITKDKGQLEQIENSKQLKNYRSTFPNLILTNFFEFRLYRNGELVDQIQIGKPFIIYDRKSLPSATNQEKFQLLLEKFLSFSTPKIKEPKKLALELAKRTRFLREHILTEIEGGNKKLEGFFNVFKKHLIGSLTKKDFANLYAQTITYGLFAARIRAKEDFNRKLAFEYIPKTIGILRDVFRYISLEDVPSSMEWMIDDISDLLAATDVKKLVLDFYKKGRGKDPIVPFYEVFLKQYDPQERKHRGVYYTPEAVVSYITRSIHKLLKNKFAKEDGFATQTVTVLDPAAGTLTFPASAIKLALKESEQKYGKGRTKSLIKDHVLKNFYAFELMMAPYTIGHLKISLLLKKFGYELGEKERFNLFLTNTLEARDLKQVDFPIISSISEESRAAGKIKREIPILVIMGNPPYSVSSDNKSDFIEDLMDLYKEEVRDERNIQPLSDDYIKFIRFAHWKIQQTGKGIIGMITNNSYLNGLIHRGMRHKLLQDFNEIYIVNLHGFSLIGETAPDGKKDENVFDIRQGVAIALFVKFKEKAKQSKVFYKDIWGLRGDINKKGTKYHYLWNNDIETTKWEKLDPRSPYYFFALKKFVEEEKYETFPKISEIFGTYAIGVKTSRDKFITDLNKASLKSRILSLERITEEEASALYYNLKDKGSWKFENALKKFKRVGYNYELLKSYDYRIFDKRFIYYEDVFIDRSRREKIKDLLYQNIALLTQRQTYHKPFRHVFVTEILVDLNFLSNLGGCTIFPLYHYEGISKLKNQQSIFKKEKGLERKINFRSNFLKLIQSTYSQKIKPDKIFYYIYGILYSNIYRKTYEEFLEIDFPRIPFTRIYRVFKKISGCGEELINLHLLNSPKLKNPISKFFGEGNNLVKKRKYNEKNKRIYINETQYFEPVEKDIWSYVIGGYQVLDKWLKSRKGKYLNAEEIKHYEKVVTAIKETIEIQKEIDKLYPEIEKNLLEF